MELEAKLAWLNQAVMKHRGQPLSPIELAVIQGSCAGHTYGQIADVTNYSASYLSRSFCPQLWHLLSDVCGIGINKKNLLTSLEQLALPDSVPATQAIALPTATPTQPSTQTDWGEAIDVSAFYGRSQELDQLSQWISGDRCRLIAILGMGGMGKTALSVKLAQQMQDQFDFVIWRTLRNAPSLDTLLADLVPFLSSQRESRPEVGYLLKSLRESRCLLILDNLETLLDAEQAGRFRPEFEAYGDLLRLLGEVSHQSCVLVTSREKPSEIAALEGLELTVRSLRLEGSPEAAQAIFQGKGLQGTAEQKQLLGDRYSNSPLALKIVATSIQELFDGNVGDFLAEDTFIFNGIRRLLDQQFRRLSALEKNLMYWLAINREWTSLAELQTDLVPSVAKGKLLETLESLSIRCLIEKQETRFTQQPVVMEYVIEQILDLSEQELSQPELQFFTTHAILKATAKDYIRETQRRLILDPLCDRWLQQFPVQSAIIEQLRHQLNQLHPRQPGYGAGNLINLLCHLKADLTGTNLAGLTIRQAYFRDTPLHQVNLANSIQIQSVFAEAITDIFGLAISPDGNLLAMTGGATGMLFIYEVPTGKWLHSIAAHRTWALSVVFDPQGKTLYTGSFDRTIVEWDMATGQCLRSWQLDSPVWSIAISADGQFLASAHDNHTIQIWDLPTFNHLQTLADHTKPVTSVAFHPQKQWLVSSSADCSLKLWDYRTNECLTTWNEHTSLVWDVKFNAQGTHIASIGYDGLAKLWQLDSRECLHTFEVEPMIGRPLAFSPDGQMLAISAGHESIQLWQVSSGQLLRVLQVGHNPWTFLFSPNGQTLICSAEALRVEFLEVNSGYCLKTLQGKLLSFWTIAFNPQGTHLASGGVDGQVRLWEDVSGHCLKALSGHTMQVTRLAYHPDLPLLASCGYDRTIKIWDDRGHCLQTLIGHEYWVAAVLFHPERSQLISAGYDATIRFWELATGQLIETINLPPGSTYIHDLALHHQGHILASGSEDGIVRLWDVESRSFLQDLCGHQSRVWTMAFHPQQSQLASGSSDGLVKLWDVDSGRCIATLDEFKDAIMSVKFSPDGKWLAVSSDRTVQVWDTATYACRQTLTGHTNVVSSVVFHPTRVAGAYSIVVSASCDETIRYWDVETGECIKVLQPDRLYEGMDITGIVGLSEGEKAVLKQLGAVEDV